MPKPRNIRQYYRWKAPEYEDKYSVGGITHIHTGHYDPGTTPELFRPGWIRPDLGVDRLKHLMRVGQDRTVSDLLGPVFEAHKPQTVLDCGAGHGGTAITIAERYGTPVDALTISPEQSEITEVSATELQVRHLVRPLTANVLKLTASHFNARYDLIFGIDAFCQIGLPEIMYRGLRRLQESGGVLAVSDNFLGKDSILKSEFDRYWTSDITREGETLRALRSAGYRIMTTTDTTYEQIPFWSLSIAYSLAKIDQSPDNDRPRESLKFHRMLRRGFEVGSLKYLRIVAVAE